MLHQPDFMLPLPDNKASVQTAVSEVSQPPMPPAGISEADFSLLLRWNGNYPEAVNSCVHDLITRQGELHPEALAVHAWDGDLTYSQLDEFSNDLAGHLTSRGIGAESVVPLCFEKSRWTLVAMLGVMKAGGAFVLLETSLPFKRLQFISADVGANVIVASEQKSSLASRLASDVVILNDQFLRSLCRMTHHPVPVLPRSALYVAYTSGSTGRPKGVVVEHRNFCAAAKAHSSRHGMTSNSRVLHFAAYAFDLCMAETIGTLLSGGCVCIPSDHDRMSRLARAITELDVNWASMTPSVSRLLTPSECSSLRTLVLTGEAMSAEDVSRWAGNVQLVNAYGPAECSVWSTMTQLFPGSDHTCIGTGSGSLTWVVDENDHHKLVPVGAVGELLIEGPVVGRGYLNRPEETHEAFIDPPEWRKAFSKSPIPSRLYKAGDLVRYAPDGSLVFLGRRDSQVKLRGQRLELAEVEHHVRHSLSEAEAVVVDVIGTGASQILVAFVVLPFQEPDLMMDQLLAAPSEEFLERVRTASEEARSALPEYMTPSVYLPIYRVPLLPSGKADQSRLRQCASQLSPQQLNGYRGSAVGKRRPITPRERDLQAVWADVLGREPAQVHADDDFFLVGGDSLRAMEMVSRAHAREMRGLSVSLVFAFPVLSDLAYISGKESDGPISRSLPDLNNLWQVPRLNPEEMESLQAGNIERFLPTTDFHRLFLAPKLKNHYVWDIPEMVDPPRLERACQALVDRHSSLRSFYVPSEDGEYVQAIYKKLKVHLAYNSIDGPEPSFSEACRIFCEHDSNTPLRPAEAYFAVTLMSAGQSQNALIIRMNHAQFDQLILDRMLEEIIAAYDGSDLPAPNADYPDYRVQRMAQKTPPALAFWRRYLDGATMTPWSPAFLGPESITAHRTPVMASAQYPLSKPLPPRITVATLVKAAWSLVLARLSQRNDLVFGHNVHGRSLPIPGTEQVIGGCMNTAPIRVTFQPSWTGHDLLTHVQEQYSRTVEYELIEPSQLIASCTSWDKKTDFGSMVTLEVVQEPSVLFHGKPCQLRPIFSPFPDEVFQTMEWPLQIMAFPGAAELTLMVMTSSHLLAQAGADRLMVLLVDALSDVVEARELSLAPYMDIHCA